MLVADNNYLWIGTEGGLIRLNLSTFEQKVYNRANSIITDNEILALALDHHNNLYVSTADFFNGTSSVRYRLFKFDGNNWVEIGINKEVLNYNESIKAIFIDKANQIYLGIQYGEIAPSGAVLKYIMARPGPDIS